MNLSRLLVDAGLLPQFKSALASKRCEKKEVEESSKFRRNGGDFHVQIYERNKKREKREDF